MKIIILTLYLCSFNTGQCIPPYQFPKQFDNYYDCLNTGYDESLKKSKEIGRERINQNGIYIRFICREEVRV